MSNIVGSKGPILVSVAKSDMIGERTWIQKLSDELISKKASKEVAECHDDLDKIKEKVIENTVIANSHLKFISATHDESGIKLSATGATDNNDCQFTVDITASGDFGAGDYVAYEWREDGGRAEVMRPGSNGSLHVADNCNVSGSVKDGYVKPTPVVSANNKIVSKGSKLSWYNVDGPLRAIVYDDSKVNVVKAHVVQDNYGKYTIENSPCEMTVTQNTVNELDIHAE